MKKIYDKNDFQNITWSKFQESVEIICSKIRYFCESQNISIDCIVPILRGGGPLGISLSHLLNVFRFYPSQYKFEYATTDRRKYIPVEYLSTIELIPNKIETITVLVTEGNHARGRTAQKCVDKIRFILPNAKIIYVSVGRDYAHTEMLSGTIFEAWGFLTNETESLTINECKKYGVKDKFVVYPWEKMEEEILEVNNSLDSDDGGDGNV